jgi:hypothetical protein
MVENNCPHLTSERQCKLIYDLTGVIYHSSTETCLACTKTDRPQRINLVTISIASRLTPEREYNLELLGTGFGTKLANLFKQLSLSEVRGCECPGHQDILDLWTPEYIRQNIDKVLDWLAKESKRRRIPFLRPITRRILLTLLRSYETSTRLESTPDSPSNGYTPHTEDSSPVWSEKAV